MPTTAAATRSATSLRRIRSERSRTSVIIANTSAAAVKRRLEYASGLKPSSRTYFVSVKLRLQMSTVTSRPSSAAEGRRTRPHASGERFVRLSSMAEPTRDDIDALVGPATPHFAYQLRARIRQLVTDL